MANDNNKQKFDQKKGLPGGFLLFLFAAVLIILTIQSMMDNKTSKVSFSHQAEHLVNLDLLQPEESRKIALGDNLVTFTGKFRERETEEAKDRFAYLDVLNKNHEFTREKERLGANLDKAQKGAADAGDFFLHISGLALPKNGYVIVGSSYDTLSRENSVVLHSLSSKGLLSLKEVTESYRLAAQNPDERSLSELSSQMFTLIQLFKSPALGIGSETLKQKLKEIENSLSSQAKASMTDRLASYRYAIDGLQGVVAELNAEQNGVRLSALRSVRSYLEGLDQYAAVSQNLEKNALLLDKSRQKVADVIWFFNNQEVSTRALEKQDPEAFGHWFSQAKAEWETFAANRGLAFKAPDQPRNSVLEKKFKSQEPSPNYLSYLFTILPVLIVVFLLYFIFSRQMKGVGSSAMNFGKSPARLLTKEQNKVTFKDVAGADEAKEELKEIVDFLKDPSKFTALGAKIPKGVLLIGPPGTGKTLIAKAVAGEANRPFFYISGSDFVEMFVGVGASRIRDMFDQAKKN